MHYQTVIVGLGAMGSAAAYHLSRRGAKILGLEQFGIPHALGSSHGESRMIRLCYYEHPDYVPLLRRASDLWKDLEQRTQQKLFHEVGGIFIGPRSCEFIDGTITAAMQHRLAHEVINRDALRQRYPQFHVPDDHIGVFEPSAGFLLPERIVATHTELALRHGAALHAYEKVNSWKAHDDHVEIATSRSTYTADRIIFCGGAWSQSLVQDLGVKLQVTRQPLGWVWPNKPRMFELGTMPVWAINNDDGSIHYGFPILPGASHGRPGFKIAHHFHGEAVTVDSINRQPQAEDELDFRAVLRRYIPDADGPLLSMAICMYTNSPDSHFIIDHHPHHKNVILACGFSGHGFKFASVVGEVLADLALNGATSHPIGFLGLNRFTAK